jgi:molybdate transport system permease protein
MMLLSVALLALILGTSQLLSNEQDHIARPEPLTVYAAAGTTDVMTAIVSAYQQATGQKVLLNFASSSTLARQIESGAQADVYISANQKWMNYLSKKDLLLSDTRFDWLATDLALIAPADEQIAVQMDRHFDFASAFEGRLAIGDPSHVPAGMYAREALESLSWWNSVEHRVASCANVRAALQLVARGETSLGIVYASDATVTDRVRIVGVFPPSTHAPIRFCAAACRGADMNAYTFLQFLNNEQALSLCKAHGFTVKEDSIRSRHESAGVHLSGDARKALMISLKTSACCLALILVPGVLCGWLLARGRFRGKVLLDMLVHAPLVMPPVVTGYLALLVLGRRGWLGQWLEDSIGLSLSFTWTGAVLVAAIMAFPLMVRSVRLAIQLVDQRIEQAAATLGSSPLKVFLTVTLPLALPGILVGLVLSFARSLGEFGATMTFAGNIEGQTRTIPLAIYTMIQNPDSNSATFRLVIISLVLSCGALAVSEMIEARVMRKRSHTRGS